MPKLTAKDILFGKTEEKPLTAKDILFGPTEEEPPPEERTTPIETSVSDDVIRMSQDSNWDQLPGWKDASKQEPSGRFLSPEEVPTVAEDIAFQAVQLAQQEYTNAVDTLNTGVNIALNASAKGADRALDSIKRIKDTLYDFTPKAIIEAIGTSLAVLPRPTNLPAPIAPENIPIPSVDATIHHLQDKLKEVQDSTNPYYDPEKYSHLIANTLIEESLAYIPYVAITSGAPAIPSIVGRMGVYAGASALAFDGSVGDHLITGGTMGFYHFLGKKIQHLTPKQKIAAMVAATEGITDMQMMVNWGLERWEMIKGGHLTHGLVDGPEAALMTKDMMTMRLVNFAQMGSTMFFGQLIHPHRQARAYVDEMLAQGKAPDFMDFIRKRLPNLNEKIRQMEGSEIGRFLKYSLKQERTITEELRHKLALPGEDPAKLSRQDMIKRLCGDKYKDPTVKEEVTQYVDLMYKLDQEHVRYKRIEEQKPGLFDTITAEDVPKVLKDVASRRMTRLAGKYEGLPEQLAVYGRAFRDPTGKQVFNAAAGGGNKLILPKGMSEKRMRAEYARISRDDRKFWKEIEGIDYAAHSFAKLPRHGVFNGIIDHEIGHMITQNRPKLMKEWKALYNKFPKSWVRDKLSIRAADDAAEGFTEAFVLYAGNPGKLPSEIFTFLDKHVPERKVTFFEQSRLTTMSQVDAAAGNHVESPVLQYNPEYKYGVIRRMWHQLMGEDLRAVLDNSAGSMSVLHNKHLTPGEKAIVMHKNLRYKDLTAFELRLIDDSFGWDDAKIRADQDFKTFVADFGNYWRAVSEGGHWMNHPKDGQGSHYVSRVHAEEHAKEIRNKWSPEQQQLAEKWMNDIDNLVGRKIEQAQMEGLIDEATAKRLHSGWMPRLSNKKMEHLYYRNVLRSEVPDKFQDVVTELSSPIKFLSPEYGKGVVPVNDPKIALEMFLLEWNAAMDKNKLAKAFYQEIKKNPEEMNAKGFYLKPPDDSEQWQRINFQMAGHPKGAKIYMHRSHYEMLNLGPVAGTTNPVIDFLNGTNKFYQSLYTKYNPLFSISRWVADSRTSFENIRLPMKAKWVIPGTFQAELLGNQMKMLTDKGHYNTWRRRGAEAQLSLQSRISRITTSKEQLYSKKIRRVVRAQRKQEKGHEYTLRDVMDEWRDSGFSETAGQWLDNVAMVNEHVNNTRLTALFKMYKDANPGMSDGSISAAINEHMNFREHGKFTPALESVVMFANPILRDITEAWRAVKYRPKGSAVKMGAAAGAIFTHEIVSSLINPEYRNVSLTEKSLTLSTPLSNGCVREKNQCRVPMLRVPLDNVGKPIMAVSYASRFAAQVAINNAIKWAQDNPGIQASDFILNKFGTEIVEFSQPDKQTFYDVVEAMAVGKSIALHPMIHAAFVGLYNRDPVTGVDYSIDRGYMIPPEMNYDITKVSSFGETAASMIRGYTGIGSGPTVDALTGPVRSNPFTGSILRIYGVNPPKLNVQNDPKAELFELLAKTPGPSRVIWLGRTRMNVLEKEVEEQNSRWLEDIGRPLMVASDQYKRGMYEATIDQYAEVINKIQNPQVKKNTIDQFTKMIKAEGTYKTVREVGGLVGVLDEHVLNQDMMRLRLYSQFKNPAQAVEHVTKDINEKSTAQEKTLYALLAYNWGLFGKSYQPEYAKDPVFKQDFQDIKAGWKKIKPTFVRAMKSRYKYELERMLGKTDIFQEPDIPKW